MKNYLVLGINSLINTNGNWLTATLCGIYFNGAVGLKILSQVGGVRQIAKPTVESHKVFELGLRGLCNQQRNCWLFFSHR